MHFDRGGEFLTGKLQEWLKQEGISIQPTALYSPSQNSIVERMNHTLMELAHMMMNVWTLPLFLWECTLQNQAYTKALKEATDYQLWTGKKLDIKHL